MIYPISRLAHTLIVTLTRTAQAPTSPPEFPPAKIWVCTSVLFCFPLEFLHPREEPTTVRFAIYSLGVNTVATIVSHMQFSKNHLLQRSRITRMMQRQLLLHRATEQIELPPVDGYHYPLPLLGLPASQLPQADRPVSPRHADGIPETPTAT